MKKTIGVFGGYRFADLVYHNGQTLPFYNYILNKLKKDNFVINFAKPDLTIASINNLVHKFALKFNFNEVYLSLGEAESTLNVANLMLFMNDFERDLRELIKFLQDNKIVTKIELLKEDNLAIKEINLLINKLSKEYNVIIINEKVDIKIIGNKNFYLSSLYI